MGWLQGGWRKLICVFVVLGFVFMIIRDRRDNYGVLEQIQRRLIACTHHADSLGSQLEVINNHKETIERMLKQEKNTSARVAQAYEAKIQQLNAKNGHLQMQLDEYHRGPKSSQDLLKLQSENRNYRTRLDELEQQIQQLNEQLLSNQTVARLEKHAPHVVNKSSATNRSTITSTKRPIGHVNPEDHEDPNIQPVDSPNMNVVPEHDLLFNRKPLEPVVFRRDGDAPPPKRADILPRQELLRKIDDRRRQKEGGGDNVEDFRDLAKPDADEMDYKDVDH